MNRLDIEELKKQAKIGVIVVKYVGSEKRQELSSANSGREPLIYADREAHRLFFDRVFATLRA